MEGCGLCGAQLDDHGIRVTVTFAAGLRNGNHFTQVPYQLKDWPLCWTCFLKDDCTALRRALADEYTEPVIEREHTACHTTCAGAKIRASRRWYSFLSVRQGSRGEPQQWARCPVCLGPCEVERAA